MEHLDPWDRGAGEPQRRSDHPQSGWNRPTATMMTTISAPSGSPKLEPPPAPSSSGTLPRSASCGCRGMGFYVADVPYGHADFAKLIPCACTEQARKARQDAATASTVALLKRDLGRLAGCTFASFDTTRPLSGAVTVEGTAVGKAQQRESLLTALGQAESYADDGQGWLYIHGPVGSGKSHLAAAAGHAIAARGRSVAYVTTGGLLAFLRGGFQDRSADQRLASLQEVSLLILDDLGTERKNRADGPSWAEEQLFEILNARYVHQRATIITSNLAPDAALDERLADRVAGMAMIIHLVASSYRQLKQQ